MQPLPSLDDASPLKTLKSPPESMPVVTSSSDLTVEKCSTSDGKELDEIKKILWLKSFCNLVPVSVNQSTPKRSCYSQTQGSVDDVGGSSSKKMRLESSVTSGSDDRNLRDLLADALASAVQDDPVQRMFQVPMLQYLSSGLDFDIKSLNPNSGVISSQFFNRPQIEPMTIEDISNEEADLYNSVSEIASEEAGTLHSAGAVSQETTETGLEMMQNCEPINYSMKQELSTPRKYVSECSDGELRRRNTISEGSSDIEEQLRLFLARHNINLNAAFYQILVSSITGGSIILNTEILGWLGFVDLHGNVLWMALFQKLQAKQVFYEKINVVSTPQIAVSYADFEMFASSIYEGELQKHKLMAFEMLRVVRLHFLQQLRRSNVLDYCSNHKADIYTSSEYSNSPPKIENNINARFAGGGFSSGYKELESGAKILTLKGSGDGSCGSLKNERILLIDLLRVPATTSVKILSKNIPQDILYSSPSAVPQNVMATRSAMVPYDIKTMKVAVFFAMSPTNGFDNYQRWWLLIRQRSSLAVGIRSLQKRYNVREIFRTPVSVCPPTLHRDMQKICNIYSLKVYKNLIINKTGKYVSDEKITAIFSGFIDSMK